MTTLVKFLFDNDFDADLAAVEPESNAEAEPPPPTFSEAELAAAREEAFAQGRDAGAETALASIENDMAGSMAQIAERLGALSGHYQEAWADCRRDALALCAAITRKMLPPFAHEGALGCIETMISETLPRLLREPRVVVRVADFMLDPLRERIDELAGRAGFSGHVILLAEDGLSGPDCRIEWADGGLDFDTAQLWQDIDEIIARHLRNAVADDAEPAGPDAEINQPGSEPEQPTPDTAQQETTDG